MPFILMLCVLLGGALVCTLLISTTLAAGSYRITKLQQSVDALARQRQTLQEQVAQAQSAQVIEQQAEQLGMTGQGQLRFFDLKTGKVLTDAGSGAVQAINVPGYTP
jgi:Na+-transporting NADH:ubiquinone oxidoreductase subunit NqrC